MSETSVALVALTSSPLLNMFSSLNDCGVVGLSSKECQSETSGGDYCGRVGSNLKYGGLKQVARCGHVETPTGQSDGPSGTLYSVSTLYSLSLFKTCSFSLSPNRENKQVLPSLRHIHLERGGGSSEIANSN